MPPLPLTSVFDDLPDPRRDTRNKLHRLTDFLTIATCAIIAGAESWEAIAEYGRTKREFFGRFLPLDNGIPGPDTFERVFAKLAPEAAESALDTISGYSPSGGTSMLYDRIAGRPLEHDYLTGAVVRTAERLGVEAPLNRAILALLVALSDGLAAGRAG